jgi:asparagine synthase (glutamine-hydrolysing)
MCGIVGVASIAPIRDRELLVAQRDTMCHRGPDDAGEWWSPDGRVGLAHRRLAIIDLSPGGHQPMSDSAGELVVNFNGEIYNYRELRAELESRGHRFRTSSDTEVLLEAYREWGTTCLDRLTGMFAFGLYDSRNDTLLLARDRAGEKPLFYHHADGTLSFASELKGLLRDPRIPRNLNAEALDHYLAYGYVPSSLCILQGFQKLAPAHALEYDLTTGRLRSWRYWSLPEFDPTRVSSTEELIDELEPILENAVRMQLVADVPVGVLLSGGVDSSIVTALAARVSSDAIKTFTVSFPGHGVFNEGPYARIVASHFGTDHYDLIAEPATVALLPRLAQQYDEPIGDSSMVPTYLVTKLVREQCTVALGGDGGDELFGGYPQYSLMLKQQRIHRMLPAFGRRAIHAVAGRLPVGVRGRTYGVSLGAGERESLAFGSLYFDAKTRKRLVPALQVLESSAPEKFKTDAGATGGSLVQRMTRSDFMTYLPDDILVKVDRASMLNSLEVRAPFLDTSVISFAFSRLPDDQRATYGSRKILLRRLGARLLPKQLDLARKQGFSLPLGTWFKGEWGRYMESVLMESRSGLFDKAAVSELVTAQRRGLSNAQRLFNLTILELWMTTYNVGLPLSR